MNTIASRSWILALLMTPLAFADGSKIDIRDGIPADAYLAVYGQQNPERDFQRKYEKRVWQTIRDEKLPQRIAALVMGLLPSKEQERATSISDELQTIFEPVDWTAVAGSPDAAYGQVMEVPQTHHLLLLRLPTENVAVALETALKKFGEMIEQRSDGAVDAAVDESEMLRIYMLSAPKVKDFPFQPAFARIDEVLILSTSAQVVRRSVASLLNGEQSKFDDPRLQVALDKLPKPEDALVFYDGKQQFSQMRGVGTFIREQSGNDEKAARFAGLFEKVVDEMAILDYEVTVEHTDGYKNIKTAFGQLLPDVEDKVLYRVFASGEPFERWQSWVPADAQGYSLSTGANLHQLYEWVVRFLRDEVPEAQPALDHFEQVQEQWNVHLDRDILQAFSGECVSVALPASSPAVVGGQDKVIALRCHNEERIRELLHQGIDWLAENPYTQSQQLKLAPSTDLDGFDELSGTTLAAFGVRPVIGFQNGWMIVASNAAAGKKVLDTLSGDAPSIVMTEQFKQFGLDVDGPVYATSCRDLAASTRRAAQLIRRAGIVVPMAVATAAASAKADPEKVKSLQDAVTLIPSVANVVEKMDYLQARLSVVQTGDAAGSYVKRTVTLVQSPVEEPDE